MASSTGEPSAAVFLDRDGVLNEIVERDREPGSPRAMAELKLVHDIDAVAQLRRAGLRTFIVTNQPDIARGHVTDSLVEQMLDAIRSRVPIDDARVCRHDDAADCPCRKPKPGMILDLARHWHVDPARSWMIGDTWRDVEAARAAGVRPILIRRPYNHGVAADLEVRTLAEAVEAVLMAGEVRHGSA